MEISGCFYTKKPNGTPPIWSLGCCGFGNFKYRFSSLQSNGRNISYELSYFSDTIDIDSLLSISFCPLYLFSLPSISQGNITFFPADISLHRFSLGFKKQKRAIKHVIWNKNSVDLSCLTGSLVICTIIESYAPHGLLQKSYMHQMAVTKNA